MCAKCCQEKDAVWQDVQIALAQLDRAKPYYLSEKGAWAMLFERVNMLWCEIERDGVHASKATKRREAIAVMTAAMRFILDCTL